MFQYAGEVPANSLQRNVIFEQMRDDVITEVIARDIMFQSAIKQAREHEEDSKLQNEGLLKMTLRKNHPVNQAINTAEKKGFFAAEKATYDQRVLEFEDKFSNQLVKITGVGSPMLDQATYQQLTS